MFCYFLFSKCQFVLRELVGRLYKIVGESHPDSYLGFCVKQGKVGSSIQSINVFKPEAIRATLSIKKF